VSIVSEVSYYRDGGAAVIEATEYFDVYNTVATRKSSPVDMRRPSGRPAK
jgi:hypothetical protein